MGRDPNRCGRPAMASAALAPTKGENPTMNYVRLFAGPDGTIPGPIWRLSPVACDYLRHSSKLGHELAPRPRMPVANPACWSAQKVSAVLAGDAQR